MNQTLELIVNTVGWTLLHSLWQGAVIYLLFILSRTVLRTANPVLRHGNALIWLVLFMLLPVLTFVALLLAFPGTQATVTATSVLSVSPISTWASQSTAAWSGGLPLLGALWLSGVIVLSIRLLRDWRALGQFTCAGARPLPQLDTAFATLREAMDVRLNVRLVEAINASVPMVVGVLKPMIVIPSSALLGLTSRELELIVAHELAHLRRKDHLINYLLLVAETLLFFHPVVYSLTRTIRYERELCCDDLVINTFNERVCYAHALSKLETLRSLELVPAASLRLAAVDGPLVTRISRLVQRRTHRRWGLMPAAMMPLVAAGFVGLILYNTHVAPGNNEQVLSTPPHTAGEQQPEALSVEPAQVIVQTTDALNLERITLDNYSRRYIDASAVSRITSLLTRNFSAPPLSAIEQGTELLGYSSGSAVKNTSADDSASAQVQLAVSADPFSGAANRDFDRRPSKGETSSEPVRHAGFGLTSTQTGSRTDTQPSTSVPVAYRAESITDDSGVSTQSPEPSAESSRIAYDMSEISTLYAPLTRQPGLPALPSFRPHLASSSASGDQQAGVTSQFDNTETVSGGALIHSVTPRYPSRARSRGYVDKVVVSIRIDAAGQVDDVSVVNQGSRPMFRRAVVRAVSQWKFEPLLRNGEAVEQTLEQSFNFQLQPYTAGRQGQDSQGQACHDTRGVVCRRST